MQEKAGALSNFLPCFAGYTVLLFSGKPADKIMHNKSVCTGKMQLDVGTHIMPLRVINSHGVPA